MRRGHAGSPSDGDAVQALRNARVFEEIAHERISSRSPSIDAIDPPSSPEVVKSLKAIGTIAIPHAKGREFDHAAFDPKTRSIFIAHTARSFIEVVDHDAGKHIATLPSFPGVAAAVVEDGQVLATNRERGADEQVNQM